jgi:ribosome-binding factor A
MAHYRPERLAHEMQRLLSELLRTESRDPRIQSVSITRVQVSGDLRHAKIYASTLDDQQLDAAVRALEHARGYVRSQLASALQVRVLPELHFFPDRALAAGDKVLGLLRSLETEGADDCGQ